MSHRRPTRSVTAISGDRAWLRTPEGGQVTVVAGERLKGVGAVRSGGSLRSMKASEGDGVRL